VSIAQKRRSFVPLPQP
jgi:outer membrane biosynthesis protein TonB